MCRSALRFGAPELVSHTLIDGYILVNVGGHFHSSHPHTFLSPPLIGWMTLEALLSTRGKISAATHLCFRPRVSAAAFASVDQSQRKVNARSNGLETLPKF